MAWNNRRGSEPGSERRKNMVRSGGVEYQRSMKGDRLDSSKVKRPNLPRVTSDDYVDYVSHYPRPWKDAGKKKPRRERHAPRGGRKPAVVLPEEGPELKGFEAASVGSSMSVVLRKYIPKKWIRVTASVVAGFLMGLLVYQVFMSFYVQFKTESVISAPYVETIDTEGITIRDETVLTGKLSDTAVRAVRNGDKISKGQPVINIFSSSQTAAAYERVMEIDRLIGELENLVAASEDNANTVDNVGRVLDERMMQLSERTVGRNLSDLAETKSDVCFLFNKRLVAMRKVEGFTGRIEQLREEKASLMEQYPTDHKSIVSDASGYYSDSADGYENLLTSSSVAGLTVDGLDRIMKDGPAPVKDCIGKLVNTFVWYLACPVPNEDAEKSLTVDSVYTLQLPYAKTGSVRATLTQLNYDGENDNYLAVFRCSTFYPELCGIRSQPVRIEKCRYDGYVIKKSALHAGVKDVKHRNSHPESDFPRGHLVYVTQATYPSVYAVVGGQINEKEVKILYSTDKLVICSPYHDKGDYLSLYDTVVVEERGLYDGKLIS